MLSQLLAVVDLTGVFANAILGATAAKQARYDPVGFIVLAIMAGLGGGILRDTLLQDGPPVALTNPLYLGMALVGAFVAFVVPLHFRAARWSLIVLDALAVGCWAAIGTQKGHAAGLHWLAAISLGVTTVVGGGILRDVLLQRRPVVFGDGNPLYATCALLASVVTMIFLQAGQPLLGTALALVVGASTAVAARWFGWTLPTEFPALRIRQRPRPGED